MSKRKSVQNRTEVLLGLAFAAVGVVMVVAPGSGSAYSANETARPSGTLPTPAEVER